MTQFLMYDLVFKKLKTNQKSYGNPAGESFSWKSPNAGNLKEISGNVGWLIDSVQLNFENVASDKFGGNGGLPWSV